MSDQSPATSHNHQNRWLELLLLSIVSLFVELFVIRWTSVDVRAFTTFKFFPLATCFVGLGVGFALGRDVAFRFSLLPFLLFVVLMKIADWITIGSNTRLSYLFFPSTRVFSWWTPDRTDPAMLAVYVLVFMLFLPLLLSAPFALCMCIGSRLGVLFNQMKPLPAYCVNIGGAIVGSVLFSLASYLGWMPWQLIILPIVIMLFYVRSEKTFALSVVAAAACIAIAFCNPSAKPQVQTFWSPYQRLDLEPFKVKTKDGSEATMGYDIYSNRAPYQNPVNLDPAFLTTVDSAHNSQVEELIRRYELGYRFKPFKDVLIVGAGSGNDVSAALRYGAESVDAVDIDPVIIKLGTDLHPEHPYQNPKVHVICDDARDYFNHCSKKYDLVIYSHLDSHVVTGSSSSVRIDNYVYTKESFVKALTLLKPGGLLVVSFNTAREWFKERLFASISAAAGYPAVVLEDKRDRPEYVTTYFIAGEAAKNGTLTIPEAYAAFVNRVSMSPKQDRVLTDDWPYMYLAPASADTPVDVPYAVVVLEFMLLSLFAGKRLLFGSSSPTQWQMFFLGAAFLLLELQSIARLSLVYGSTWQTSAIVIVCVLLMILAANILLLRTGPIKNMNIPYALLFASLLASYFLPVDHILASSALPPYLASAFVTFMTVLPMFMAALIFGSTFAVIRDPGRALAFNLFGSVVGALLEYSSNYCGIRNLVLIALGLYLMSYVFARMAAGKGKVTQ